MKKIVVIGLSLMLFCFITGGIYIVKSIFDVTNKLEKVISFQRVEILRDNLVHHIKSAQSDLLLQGSPHQSETDATVQYTSEIETVSNLCLDCHHSSDVTFLLKNLKEDIQEYLALISRTLTIQGNPQLLAQARTEAFANGERLLDQVTSLSIASAHKISSRIDKIREDINKTNNSTFAAV
jgi:two-component system sensor histidine kinase AtoS